ncbi:MAG: non-hydrolyzing UDP-N-acetylglucosamine 2-epimerase [Candidatus Kapaibacterium sp.]
MIKIISVVGARPNFMKVAPIHRELKKYPEKFKHIIVHTGQHYDVNMSDAFFKDLEMPEPDFFLGVGSGSHAVQTAKIMTAFEEICEKEKPDLVLVVGDVNSTIACGITAVKMGIRLAHVEAGLRSFDRGMPEEINRVVTDAISSYAFITEESAAKNLKNEGFPEENIYFTGHPMIDSQKFALEKAEQSNIMQKLGVNSGEYALMTLHRPSNVDTSDRLLIFVELIEHIAKSRKIVLPLHPRTAKNIAAHGFKDRIEAIDKLILSEPLGYLDFLKLMKNSDFILTDSGGIQEESTALGKHCLTLRTTTERPVTVEIGTNYLIKPEKEEMLAAVNDMINGERKIGSIPEKWDGKASERIVSIIDKLFNNQL